MAKPLVKDYVEGQGGLVQVAGTVGHVGVWIASNRNPGSVGSDDWREVLLDIDAAKHLRDRLDFYIELTEAGATERA